MRLTKVARMVVQNAEIKELIAETEGVHLETVRRWVRDDHENLTKGSVVKVIKDVTGLKEDQILEEELVNEPAK